MNKLFLSIFLLVPLSLNAMDYKPLLAVTGAVAVGIGGNMVASRIYNTGMAEIDRVKLLSPKSDDFKKGKENYVRNSDISGALRTGSTAAAAALVWYACTGNAPANNGPTYASTLAIATGGAMWGWGRAKKVVDELKNNGRKRIKYTTIFCGGLALAAGGAFVLGKNS